MSKLSGRYFKKMFGLFRTLEENDNLNLHIKKIDISKIQGSPHFTFHVYLSTFTYNLPYMMLQNYHYKESILKYYKHKNYKLYFILFPLIYIYTVPNDSYHFRADLSLEDHV